MVRTEVATDRETDAFLNSRPIVGDASGGDGAGVVDASLRGQAAGSLTHAHADVGMAPGGVRKYGVRKVRRVGEPSVQAFEGDGYDVDSIIDGPPVKPHLRIGNQACGGKPGSRYGHL
jgi:hypothetical protein